MMHVLDSHLTKKDKPPSEAPSVLNNRDQNEVQPSEPTKVEEKAPVEKEAENLEIKSVEAESPAPTVVEPQEQPVEIPISDTKEKVVVRPKRFKKSEFVSGFDDLAQYEFSTPLFPLVAEMLCTNNPHLLNDRDGLYVFHCKICDLMFPKLDVLDFHFTRKHMDVYETLKSGSPSTLEQNIVVESKDSKVQDVDETPVAMSESEDTPPDEFLALLKLERKGVRDAKLETKKLENAQTPKTFGITYGMNNEYFYTSPAPGYHRQPSWMRNDDSGTITIPDKRYFAPVSAQTPSSAPNTNQMIELYGIKVAVDDNGKRTYRCRICTYDSHEKSTIVRHQRTHTGIRPFTCSNCKYSFTTKANCERHIKKRHADILKRERCDAKSLVESNDEQIKRLREGGYGLRDPNFISNGTNVRQRHRPFNSKCLICLMIFSSHAACVKHLARDHNVPEDKAAGKLANILPSASDTPMSISPTMISKDADEFNNFAQCLSAESDNMDYTSGNSTPVPNYQRQELEARLKSVLQTGDDRKSSTGTGIWKRRSIIPLAQVEAFNDATKKLREYFERDYAAVIDSTINNTDYEGVHSVRRLNSKFSSLLTAASCQIVRSKRKRTLSRTIHSAPYNRLRPQQPLFKSSFPNSRHNNFRPIKPKLLREDNYKESPSSSSMAGVAHQSTSETSQSCTEAHIEATDSQASNIVASSIFNSDYAQLYKNLLFANDSCPSINGQSEANSVERTTTSQTGYNDSLSTIEKSVNQSQQQQQQPILGNSTNEAQDDTGVNESTESLMKDTEECNEAASPSTSLKVSTFRMNLLNNMKKNLMMNSKGNRHGSSYMLPTMVDINKKNLVYLSDAVVGTNGEHSDKRFSQPRKCPKCVKTFPWASSLRRHIMTHTGLKPHMCSLCNMRFTTRSNLLRHAYRRHQIDRNSVERQNIVISLSPEEQQRFAEEEARVLVESNQEAAVEQETNNDDTEQQEQQDSSFNHLHTPDNNGDVEGSNSFMSSSFDTTAETSSLNLSSLNSSVKVKKYLCGRCNVPFANRSNVVRHLSKQHNITKDHKDFKSLLVKIEGSYVVERPNRNVINNNSLLSITSGNSFLDNTSTPISKTKSESNHNTSISKVSTVKSPKSETQLHTSATKPPKEFKCTICNIGFTKRNNAARHVQQQHSDRAQGVSKSNFVTRIVNTPPQTNHLQTNDIKIDKQVQESNGVVLKELEDTESTSSRRADDVDENNSCGDEARPATVVIDIIEPGNASMNSNDSSLVEAPVLDRPRLVTRIKVPPMETSSNNSEDTNSAESDPQKDSTKSFRAFAKAKEHQEPKQVSTESSEPPTKKIHLSPPNIEDVKSEISNI